MTHEAQYYLPLPDGNVKCTLCPHMCILKEGKSGICRVRQNLDGKLVTEVYGYISSLNFDPIEKKPLYHFYPGSTVLSIGTYGCNLRCFFCQNCTISQTAADPELPHTYYAPSELVQLALNQPKIKGIAFTYNEPVVWFEYMIDIARLAKKAGLFTVMVTNGFINREPLDELLDCIDAFSIDLKAFSEDFYTKVTSSKLEPVKKSIKQIKLAGKHVEIVNLVIPGLNDDDTFYTSMVEWIANEIGRDTVLHISRYFPNYKMITEATPIAVMRKVKRIAEKELQYVYSGNVSTETNDTICKYCNNTLITRYLYDTSIVGLDDSGRCSKCGNYFLKKP